MNGSYVIISSSLEPERVTRFMPQQFPFTLPINAQYNHMVPVEGLATIIFKQGDRVLNEIKIQLHPGSGMWLDKTPFERAFLGEHYDVTKPIDVFWMASSPLVVMGYEFKE